MELFGKTRLDGQNMEPSEMLTDMYMNCLKNADLKAICENRGFSIDEVSSFPLFRKVYLSSRGLQSALGSLSKDEIVLLYIMKFTEKPVTITFFQHLYGKKNVGSENWAFESFNARYKDIFKQVRNFLVRKGILLIAEEPDFIYKTTKMERWRFSLPTEFEEYLPSPFDSPLALDTDGNTRDGVLRRKLMEDIQGKHSRVSGESQLFDIYISNGKLHIGNCEFRSDYLKKWQECSWRATSFDKEESITAGYQTVARSPLDIALSAFSELKQNEWVHPDELTRFWRNLYPPGEFPENERICAEGWKWGYLSRATMKGKMYYRLEENRKLQPVTIEQYLRVSGKPRGSPEDEKEKRHQAVIISLESVPYEILDVLTQISKMEIVDSQLYMTPDFIGIGNAPPVTHNHPVVQWLEKNSLSFRVILRKVKERRGKMIIHENILIARVKDLPLLVNIQKSFSDIHRIIPLKNDFIAFPRDLLPDIQKIVKRTGHVIKTIEAEVEKVSAALKWEFVHDKWEHILTEESHDHEWNYYEKNGGEE